MLFFLSAPLVPSSLSMLGACSSGWPSGAMTVLLKLFPNRLLCPLEKVAFSGIGSTAVLCLADCLVPRDDGAFSMASAMFIEQRLRTRS